MNLVCGVTFTTTTSRRLQANVSSYALLLPDLYSPAAPANAILSKPTTTDNYLLIFTLKTLFKKMNRYVSSAAKQGYVLSV